MRVKPMSSLYRRAVAMFGESYGPVIASDAGQIEETRLVEAVASMPAEDADRARADHAMALYRRFCTYTPT